MEKEAGFLAKIRKIYPDDFDEIKHLLYTERPVTFRVNTLKAKVDSVISELSSLGFTIQEGPFVDSYIVVAVPEGIRLSETRAFNEGLLYIQSLSSMVPAHVLDPRPGEKILDLCAAPGGKTTQIAQITANAAQIVAVEKNRDRFFLLKSTLKKYCVSDVEVVLGDGISLWRKRPEYIGFFDKVLVDAPCSNEGQVCMADKEALKFWHPRKAKEMARTQKGLIMSGMQMLKPGGVLVYSTCTFSVEENEKVVDWLLKKMPDVRVEPLILRNGRCVTGFTSWNERPLNDQVSKTCRIVPDAQWGGFFVAKLKRGIV